MKKLFRNTWFHRSVYFILFLLWTLKLSSHFDCWSCSSSLGIPYWRLYWPVAIILLLLVIFDEWIIWFSFFLFSVFFSFVLVLGDYNFRIDNQTKTGWSDFDCWLGTVSSALVCVLFLALLYLIRPVKKDKMNKMKNK